jgi:hypothetical protein
MKMYSDAVVNKDDLDEIEKIQAAHTRQIAVLRVLIIILFTINFTLTAACYLALQ